MSGRAVRAVVRSADPIDRRLAVAFLFPPGIVIGRHRDVREDRVLLDRFVGVAVRVRVRAGDDAEVAGLGIDRTQLPRGVEMHPRDVVAERPDLPALLALGRDQHREIRFAAGGRERACEIVRLALRILDADDQHVLGEPAFGARLVARDSQRVTLLAEQRVAAVARAVAHDRELFGEVHDEAALGIELARRMQAFDEGLVFLDAFERRLADPSHQVHVCDDIGAVGDLDAAARVRRVDRTHAIRNHVHRPAAHGAGETLGHLGLRLGGREPVVVRARIDPVVRADERQMLDAGDVLGIGAVQVATGIVLLVELEQRAAVEHLLYELAVFLLGAFAPVNSIGTRELGHLRNPVAQALKARRHWGFS